MNARAPLPDVGFADPDMFAAHREVDPVRLSKGLLQRRVPLTLILDLMMPAGPHSTEILAHERETEIAVLRQALAAPMAS